MGGGGECEEWRRCRAVFAGKHVLKDRRSSHSPLRSSHPNLIISQLGLRIRHSRVVAFATARFDDSVIYMGLPAGLTSVPSRAIFSVPSRGPQSRGGVPRKTPVPQSRPVQRTKMSKNLKTILPAFMYLLFSSTYMSVHVHIYVCRYIFAGASFNWHRIYIDTYVHVHTYICIPMYVCVYEFSCASFGCLFTTQYFGIRLFIISV